MSNFIYLILVTLIAAGTPVMGRVALEQIPPIALGFVRFSVAALLLLFTLFVVKKKDLKFKKEHRLHIFILGLICIPINQLTFLGGLHLSAASHAGLIYGLSPVLVLIFSLYSKFETVSKRKLLGFVFSFFGVAYLFIDSGFNLSSDFLLGDVILFFAVLSWAAYITYSKSIVVEYGALKVTTGVFTVGSICYAPIALFDIPNIPFSTLTISTGISFFYLSVITSFFGYFLWAYIIKRMETTKVVIMSNLSPLIAVFFGVVFLNEPLTHGLWLGSILTVSGIFIVQWSD